MTIDRHEWYAAPQIYTRDGLTGLWTSKPAIQSSSPMLSSPLHIGQSPIDSCSNIGEPVLMDHNYQTGIEVMADGYVKMQTDEESLVDGDYVSSEQKRRRVEEDISMIEGNVLSDGVPDRNLDQEYASMDGTTEDMSHDIGAALSNASLAEQVIEPALVMFEVRFYFFIIRFLRLSKMKIISVMLGSLMRIRSNISILNCHIHTQYLCILVELGLNNCF